jgi:glycine C-acetyltransferase/8-amino-7-oxononanoate synthase
MNDWQHDLNVLERDGMLRFLRKVEGRQGPTVQLDGKDVLLLCSNNYLGLAAHPEVVEKMIAATKEFGVGTGASRLISGTMKAHTDLEERIAQFKGTEAALIFNSGYAANTGILQGLFGPDDVIFSDALNHASIIDGCRLSAAKRIVYPHGDTAKLAEMMEHEKDRRKGRWVIVTDGIFSMDGDLAPLVELCDLKDKFNTLIMVDDAHGTGVLGQNGRGTAESLHCMDRIDFHMGTLGKALGCAGAFLAAERSVVDTLINRSRPFIFSTALPPGILAAAKAALDIVESPEGETLREKLELNRFAFKSVLESKGLDTLGSTTHIIPILTKHPGPTMIMSEKLLNHGIFLHGVRPPTVPEGKCRLRATIMSTHSEHELKNAADKISRVFTENNDESLSRPSP